MEGLRPERDELDRFNSRQAKPKKVSAKKDKDESSRSGVLIFISLLLLVACVLLGWGYLSQQAQVNDMQKELSSATNFISQSKLLMARFEGELNEADAEMEQSGSVVAQKLAFLDSEMRKLWGVSNDRNKKAIKANQKAVENLESKVAKESNAFKSAIEKKQAALSKNVDSVKGSIVQLESMVKVATSEISVTRELINEEIDGLKSSIENTTVLSQHINDNKQAIDSIDASRLQLNERIVAIEGQLNKLRLTIGGAKKGLQNDGSGSVDSVVEVQ